MRGESVADVVRETCDVLPDDFVIVVVVVTVVDDDGAPACCAIAVDDAEETESRVATGAVRTGVCDGWAHAAPNTIVAITGNVRFITQLLLKKRQTPPIGGSGRRGQRAVI
jgi:hypothetical protein